MSKDLTAALERLMRNITDSSGDPLPLPLKRGDRPASESAAVEAAAQSKGGVGMVSPLTEKSRTFYSTYQLPASTDGVFRFRVRCIKQIDFDDATGKLQVFKFADQP